MLTKELSQKKVMCSLVSLNLSGTYLKARAVLQLAEALKHNRNLVKLDLSGNGFDSKCGGYLAKILPLNFSLHILNLANNELLDEFIYVLIENLEKNSTLFECDITDNPFSTFGAHCIY
jgi:Ran GTPase-activating protein (RanGAP) involved in mRNA processing and transport